MVTAQSNLEHSHSISLPANTWVPEGQIKFDDDEVTHTVTGHGLTDRTGIAFSYHWEWRGQGSENRNADPPHPTPILLDGRNNSDPIYAVHGMMYSRARGLWGRPLKHGSYPFRVHAYATKDGAACRTARGL